MTCRLPSKSGGATYRGIHCCLLRSVFSNVIIYNVTTATSSTNERYMRRATVFLFIMFYEYMFSYCLFSFSMLFNISSMFELHVVIATVVIFNILELIIEIVPNYPTDLVST
jgi:hypothetical protein